MVDTVEAAEKMVDTVKTAGKMVDTVEAAEKKKSCRLSEDEFAEENKQPEVSGINWDHIRDTFLLAGLLFGPLLLLVVCARNSTIWYFERFWGSSRELWQGLWEPVHGAFYGNDFLLWYILSSVTVTLSFWGSSLFFMMVDIYGWPEFILQYKIQEDKNIPIDTDKLWKATKVVMFNFTVIGTPMSLVSYCLMTWRGCSFGAELPSFHSALFHLICIVLIEEVMFYYSHRLFHHPRLYKHIHKKHHEWTAPVGVIAIYAHPLEHIVSNLTPVLIGPIIMGSHVLLTCAWFAIANLTTVVSHCGYHLPLMFSPEFHDFHHLKFNYCYGVLGLLDRLHGTDSLFRTSPEGIRHQVFMGLTPMSKLYPTNDKVMKGSLFKVD